MGRIVYDHLAPENPSLQGQYAFYGPTLSYDGIEWRKGRWQFVSDVSVRNAKRRQESRIPGPKKSPSRQLIGISVVHCLRQEAWPNQTSVAPDPYFRGSPSRQLQSGW